MLRQKAIAIMVRRMDELRLEECVFQNMQSNGLKAPRTLKEECFTLTSAMGLGGGQTPIIIKSYE